MRSKSMTRALAVAGWIFVGVWVLHAQTLPKELKNAHRLPKKNGWTYVHLQGAPHEIGFQNGYLLAPEIQDLLQVVRLEHKHDSEKDWSFFRDAAQNMFWPHIEQEYREELRGIADERTKAAGIAAR